MMSSNPSSASSTSYLSQLQKALLARSGAAPPPGSISSPVVPTPTVPTQSFQQQLQPQQLMEPTYQSSPEVVEQEETDEENENGLPFSDAIYDEMKFVISKLSDRLKYKLVLSQKDFERFEASVLSILRDARRKAGLPVTPSTPTIARATASPSALFTPPQVTQMPQSSSSTSMTTITTTSPKKAGVKSDEAFNSLKGKSSTWHVEGMDNMSTEEYYDALNKRNSAVRAQLKITSGSERNSGDKYLDSLSKRTAESK